MNVDLMASLKQQTVCPDCGANWTELEQSLKEDIDSENCWLALVIVRNCACCQLRFADEIIKLREARE